MVCPPFQDKSEAFFRASRGWQEEKEPLSTDDFVLHHRGLMHIYIHIRGNIHVKINTESG